MDRETGPGPTLSWSHRQAAATFSSVHSSGQRMRWEPELVTLEKDSFSRPGSSAATEGPGLGE